MTTKLFCITLFLNIFCFSTILCQNNFFKDCGYNKVFSVSGSRVIVPEKYRGLMLNYTKARKFLKTVPTENSLVDRKNAPVLSIIKPDGSIGKFRVWESKIQEGGDKTSPNYVYTFAGQGIDDPYATIRFDFSKFGFHAQVRSPHGDYLIDPYAINDKKRYVSYYKVHLVPKNQRDTGTTDMPKADDTPIRIKQ